MPEEKTKLAKGDFVAIEFVGKLKDGGVFDSNKTEELKKLHAGHNHEVEGKPFVFCLGHQMFLRGVEEFLLGKEKGSYTIELSSDKAFGPRKPELVQRMPLNVFHAQKLNPVPGATFNFDGKVGKVLTVSGGRVMVDFNNPLAGKDVVYDVTILEKVTGQNKKIAAVNDFFFRKDVPFSVNEKTLTLELDKGYAQFALLFKEKYKELLDLELAVKEIEEKKEEGKNTEEKKD